jgi:hypothetical protein
VTSQTTTTPATPAPAPTGKKKRGRESAGDMIRSLALVMLLVLAMWFFAQPPETDEAAIRPVDPAPELQAFERAVPGAPVLGALPEGWRATSSRLGNDPDRLNVGHVTPSVEYAEYAVTTAPRADALLELVGSASPSGTVDVGGETWDRYDEADGSTSLVRTSGPVTVVVGTLRATASDEELLVLAGAVRTR